MNEQSQRPRVSAFRNVVANWGAFIYGGIVSFCLAPVVVRELGDSRYGVWILLGTLVGYLGIIDFGVRGAVMRYVANLHAAARHDEAGRVASAGLVLFGLLGIIAITVACGLAYAVEHVFSIPDHLARRAELVLIIGGVNIAVSLLSGVFGGVIAALQRFDVISVVEVAIETVRACLIVFALSAGYGMVGLATVQLSMSLARGIVSAVLMRRLYPQLHIGPRSWDRSHVRQLVGFSFYSTLLQVSSLVVLEFDAVIISAFLPIAMVGYFAIAANLVGYARTLVSAAAQTLTPRVSALEGTDDQGSTADLSLTSGRWATLLLLLIALTLMFRGETFIHLWVGQPYADLSGPVLTILTIALMGESGRLVIFCTMLGLNQHKALVPVFMIEAILTLSSSLLLVQSFGIVGVAFGTALPRIIGSVVLIPAVLCRLHGIRLTAVWREVWVRPILAMVPFGLATYFIEQLTTPTTFWAFFATVALALPLGLIGAWRIGLNRLERSYLVAAAAARFRSRSYTGMEIDSDAA